MDAWAASFGAAAAFVCVSCGGPQLASQFGTQLKLKHCHNTWVDEDDMPAWGQLGCNGFIVIDGSHSVVCKASRAYLEVKTAAFRHVETLLSALIVEKPLPPTQESGRVDASIGGACATVRFGADGKAEAAEAESTGAGTGAPSKVASVKVAVLDEEHERCEAALARLMELRSVAALRELLAAYEEHFAHEEALLDEHLYANVEQATGFSVDKGARTSHFADHEAMTAGLRKMLSERSELFEQLASISAPEVQRLAADFERHATAYDGGYADRLSASLAAAGSVA
jgi:hemerythrin